MRPLHVIKHRLRLPQACLLGLLVQGFVRAEPDTDSHQTHEDIKNREIKGTTEVTIPIRSHSIYAPYVDSDLQNRWFDFGGSTIIDTNRHIRLTQDRSSQAGFLWSRFPLTHSSFQVDIEFKIDGKSASVYGDGMAIWLSKSTREIGPVFGSSDHWDGFGIFIDTFPNSRHSYAFPRIMGMANYGYKSYDVGKDGDGQESGACSYSVRHADVATRFRIHYVRGQFLELLVQYNKWDEWEHCFTVANYTLPESPYLGFTAHTGEVSDNHDIISVSTNGLVYHPPLTPGTSGPLKQQNKSKDGRLGGFGTEKLGFWRTMLAYITWILKWGVVVGVVGAGLLAGKKYFMKYQKETMKRF